MSFKLVLLFTIFIIHSVHVEKNNKYESNSKSNNGTNKMELRLKLTELELKLKDLELQNLKIQKSLDEMTQLMKGSPSGRQTVWKFPRDCKEVQDRGNNVTDIYRIQPDPTSGSFLVVCDMMTRGGGWTLVLNRHDGKQDFNLGWIEYRDGFGHLGGEFWMGLENLRKVIASSQVSELLVELVDWDMQKVYAHYNSFSIGTESEGYVLKLLAQYSGDAGDSFSAHLGKKFSTKDKDNDNNESGNCASYRYGGWWYDNCFFCKLTGKYLKGNLTAPFYYQGIHWPKFKGPMYSMKEARMMVRPRDHTNPIKLQHEEVH